VLILALVLLILGATFRQIKIQRNRKKKFKELAFKDEFTKIANRCGILAFAKTSYQQIKIDNKQLIMAIIDLDHFKKVNDTYGHDVGDEVLKYFAIISSKSLRSYERIGRFGGEEWLLVLPNAKPAELDNKFKQLLKVYQETRPTAPPKDLMLSFSMGAVIVEADDNRSVQDLLKQADIARYKAKVGGRGRYEVAK
jgi:diguanylate cyclase (GGDEF)-like protein